MNMMPYDLVALAEARREAVEREMQIQHQLALLPRQPARWRQVTGGGLVWVGAALVQWGEGLTPRSSPQPMKVRTS